MNSTFLLVTNLIQFLEPVREIKSIKAGVKLFFQNFPCVVPALVFVVPASVQQPFLPGSSAITVHVTTLIVLRPHCITIDPPPTLNSVR